MRHCLWIFACLWVFRPAQAAENAKRLLPVPDKLVVLTFDDGKESAATFVAPLLKRYGFGATFYISEGLGFLDDKERYLTWEQIKKLNDDGFEIGNHTRSHPNLVQCSPKQILAEVEHIKKRCKQHDIPLPKTFCCPGGHHSPELLEVLTKLGYPFAKRGVAPEYPQSENGDRGPAYDPCEDHPLLIPTTGCSGPNWTFEDLVWAVEQARSGKIAVLVFHGVPDHNHPFVSTEPAQFAKYMKYLHEQGCTVIAMRDLAKYVDPARRPADPYQPIFNRLGVTPVRLKCEYAVNPVGIDAVRPRFSWQLESTRRDQTQAAYQILVASSEGKLKQGIGDLWDSGKVVSSRSVNVPYRGRPLVSGQRCWWKVRCWNRPGYDGQYAQAPYYDPRTVQAMREQRPGAYSAPATFEMGLLKQSDWQGKWIGAGKEVSSPLLRKAFTFEGQIKRATVYICGLGYYELYVNGRKVGDHVLDPGTTYYNNDQPFELGSRVLYVTYDVTDHLKTGGNALGVMLGHGWYSAEKDIPPSPSHREPYGDRPTLLLQLHVELSDGKSVNVVSDESWKTSAGPITYNDYHNGETYDARREIPGWCSAGFDDSNWSKAQEVKGPDGKLTAQMMPPIRVIKTIKPVRLLKPKENVYVYDFGQLFSGWTRLRVRGPKGAIVTMKHGARVYDDGSLDARSNLYNLPDSEEDYRRGKGRTGGWHHVARQTETYVLKGNGEETWEPRFTVHGFRYAELSGFPGTPTLESLQGRVVRSAVETSGSFTCSNRLINQIHSNVCWSFMNSMQSMPTSGTDRSERPAWLGDPGFIAEDYMYNFDTAAFWSKWLNDLKDNQMPNGDLPVVSPLHWRRTFNAYGIQAAWDSTYPLIVWYVYQYYEDERVLKEHYDGLKRLVGFLGTNAKNHILSNCFGDHMEPQPDGTSSFGPRHTPVALTSTAYYYFDVWILARAAETLGKTEDAKRYADLAEEIKAAFNGRFLDETTNQYATGSQTSNAMALYLRLVPKEREQAVLKNLVDDILIDHKGHLSTGIIGTNALEQVLGEYGRADVMYTIATQTTFPSWGQQVLKGATTLWETWEGETKPQLSYDMAMVGSTEKFFYKDLAGIGLAGPGFRQITIKPCPVGDLTYVRASLKTVRGPVAVSWKRGDKSLELKVQLPVNSRAKVSVPTLGLQEFTVIESGTPVRKNGSYVGGVAGITGGVGSADDVTFDVGSGSYRFKLTGTAPREISFRRSAISYSHRRKGFAILTSSN